MCGKPTIFIHSMWKSRCITCGRSGITRLRNCILPKRGTHILQPQYRMNSRVFIVHLPLTMHRDGLNKQYSKHQPHRCTHFRTITHNCSRSAAIHCKLHAILSDRTSAPAHKPMTYQQREQPSMHTKHTEKRTEITHRTYTQHRAVPHCTCGPAPATCASSTTHGPAHGTDRNPCTTPPPRNRAWIPNHLPAQTRGTREHS